MQQEGMPAARECRILLRECVLLQQSWLEQTAFKGSANQIKYLAEADYQQIWY
jgi:hypothetical protein